MSKKRKRLPPPGVPYEGAQRLGDWSLDNIIPLAPGEILVNDDQEDPNKFARQGEPPLKP